MSSSFGENTFFFFFLFKLFVAICCVLCYWYWFSCFQDMTQPTPTQELVAKDLHGLEWRFKHIFRGTNSYFVSTSVWMQWNHYFIWIAWHSWCYTHFYSWGNGRQLVWLYENCTTEVHFCVPAVLAFCVGRWFLSSPDSWKLLPTHLLEINELQMEFPWW